MAQPMTDKEILNKKPTRFWGKRNLQRAIEIYSLKVEQTKPYVVDDKTGQSYKIGDEAEHRKWLDLSEKAISEMEKLENYLQEKKREQAEDRIRVCCNHCQSWFKEKDVYSEDADYTTEDYCGKEADVMHFNCPKCGKRAKSYRMGR